MGSMLRNPKRLRRSSVPAAGECGGDEGSPELPQAIRGLADLGEQSPITDHGRVTGTSGASIEHLTSEPVSQGRSGKCPPLDVLPTRNHNVPVRGRLLLVVAAVAVLTFAGLRDGDQRSTKPHSGIGACGQLAGQPAPDPESPAIVRAAVTTSATVQTHLASESLRHLRPAQRIATASGQTPVDSNVDAARPRSFPLLI